MKLKTLNTIAVGIPILILMTYPFFGNKILSIAALSTMATGFLQVIAGFWFWSENPKNRFIMAYLAIVAVYFILLFFAGLPDFLAIGTPAFLAVYLSILIYTHKNHEL